MRDSEIHIRISCTVKLKDENESKMLDLIEYQEEKLTAKRSVGIDRAKGETAKDSASGTREMQ